MNENAPSKTEQIEALLNGEAGDLVLKYIPRDQLGPDRYRRVFTATRKEVEEYVKQNYKLSDLIRTSSGDHDGFYAIPVPGGYHTYYQERNIREPDYLVQPEDEVWRLFIDYILKTSGTGLKFE